MGLRLACKRLPIPRLNRRVPRMPSAKLLYGVFRLLPRAAVHGLLAWALWCTFQYAPQVGVRWIEYLFIIVNSVAAILASWAYFNVWFYGPGSPLDFAELTTSCIETSGNADINRNKLLPKFSDPYRLENVPYPDQTKSYSQQPNMQSTMQSNMQSTMQSNMPNMPNMQANMQANMPNMQSNVQPTMQSNMPASNLRSSHSSSVSSSHSSSGSIYSSPNHSQPSLDPLTAQSMQSVQSMQSTQLNLPVVMQNTVEAKYDGTARYCQKCQCYKPDRTHHCRHCGKCILRMDHHCPWFACCIGFKNHRYFVQFLGHGLVLALTSTLLSVTCLVQFVRYEMYLEFVLSVNFVFFLVMGIVFSLILVVFGPYTFYQVVINRTTLEGMEPSPYRTQVAAAHWRFRRPPDRETLGNMYDLGTAQNMREIMGSSWVQWVLPIRATLPSNGTTFSVNEELRQRACDRANVELEMRRRREHYYEGSQQLV